MQRYLSAILFNVDVNRLAEVKDLMKRAMENHSRNRMIFLLAHDSAHYGEFCLCKGDLAMAEEKLSKAIEKSEASKK